MKKLIRDGRAQTSPVEALSQASGHEMPRLLCDKLIEEVEEVFVAIGKGDRIALVDELADVFSALDALCSNQEVSIDRVAARAAHVRSVDGGFNQRYVLDTKIYDQLTRK